MRFSGVILLSAVFMISCDNNDDFTGHSKLTPANSSASIDISSTDVVFVGDSTFELTVTLTEPQIVDVAFYITALEGTAVEDEDFSIENSDHRVFIPAGQTSGVAEISFSAGDEPKTIAIQIGDGRTANVNFTPVTVNFTMLPLLSVQADWSGTFTVDEEELDFADEMDFDLYLYDGDGNEVTGYAAATGSSPEHFSFPKDLPDGTYSLYLQPYDTYDFEGNGVEDIATPVTFTFTRLPGEHTIVYNEISAYDDELFYDVSGDYNEYHIADIIKTGNTYEIRRADGTSLGSL